VVRVARVLKILQMASHAGRLRQVVVVVDVAVGALRWRHRVAAGEREPRQRMVEPGVQPVVGRVARLASGGEFSGDVIWILSGRKILLVATEARRGHGVELAERAVLVAGVAGSRGVRAGQREPVHVLVDLLHRNLPAADGVTGLAVGTHLALVNVGVAVGALVADIGENHFGVASGASYALMHAAQGEFRQIVVELRHGADRLPSVNGVAVLAGEIQIAMRAMAVLSRRLGGRSRRRQEQQTQEHAFRDQTWKQVPRPHTSKKPPISENGETQRSNRLSNESSRRTRWGQRYDSWVFISTIRISFKNLTVAARFPQWDRARTFFPICAQKLRFKEMDMLYKLDGLPRTGID